MNTHFKDPEIAIRLLLPMQDPLTKAILPIQPQYSFEEISARLRAIGREPKTDIELKLPGGGMGLSGRIYGFPDCCIDTFCNSWSELPQESVFDGSGFRPCKSCKETKTKEQLEDEIASRRLIPFPFYHSYHEALPSRYYRNGFELEEELHEHLYNYDLLKLLNKYPYLYDLAKDCWVPVERELHCYRNEFDTGKGYYYFTDKYQNRVLPVLSPDGKVRFKSMKKKSFRKGRLVDPAKAAKLREQYPELYANRDFKFDRSRFTARIGQELFSIKKEDYHDRSI